MRATRVWPVNDAERVVTSQPEGKRKKKPEVEAGFENDTRIPADVVFYSEIQLSETKQNDSSRSSRNQF